MGAPASTKKMEITKILLKLNPKIVSTEEAIEQLVLGDSIDFDTGMALQQALAEEKTAAADNTTVVAGDINDTNVGTISTEADGTDSILFAGTEVFNLEFPSDSQGVIIRTALELASADEKESFLAQLDKLNLAFENIYKVRRADIINAVTPLVGLNPADEVAKNGDVAAKLWEDLKDKNFKFIKS